jgi:dihydroorotase
MLFSKGEPGENLIVRGARVLDPVEQIAAVLDVRIDGGTIAEIGARLDPNAHRVVEAEGLTLAPAFVDPHVHLRTPGREDEETIASGTQAAAAGGYCAILAMPNTEPVVDSAAVLGSLAERAQAEAEIPVGFLAAISKGQEGAELTEMGELADAGAAGFSDDGRPVTAPGLMRRALQYGSVTDRTLALHCEEPTLSRSGQMHEGAVSAELGFAGYPSVAESLMVERDLSLAAYEGRPVHMLHLSARESVDAVRTARNAGVQATAEATPHHLCLTDDAIRSLDANLKMNPPLRSADDRAALVEGLRDGTIQAVATDHAPHARHEKEVPFEAAPFGVTGLETAFAALHTHLVEPGLIKLELLLERMSAGPAAVYGIPAPRIAAGEQANPRRVARGGERLPLPLRQLLAPRPAADRKGADDDRRRQDGVRGMTAQADYRGLVQRVLESRGVSFTDVDQTMLALGGGSTAATFPTDASDALAVLDCYQTVRELEPDDGSHPWNQAGRLKELEEHTEAAALYLRAAELFSTDAREGTGDLGDEEDWAQAALSHAVNALLASERPLTAAVVATRIDDAEYRRKAQDSVRKWLA